jgi:acetyl esterase/lipase
MKQHNTWVAFAAAVAMVGGLGVWLLATPAHAVNSAPTNGLVGYWAFDDASGTTAIDSSGSGNNGTLACNGSCPLPIWSAGKINGSLNFTNANSLVTVPDSSSLHLANQFSITFWLKKATGSYNLMYLSKGNFTNGFQVATGNPGNYLYINMFNSGGQSARCTANNTVQDNVWQHFAITDDGTAIRIYENGNQVSSCTTTASIGVTSSPLLIGGYYTTTPIGNLDEVRVYNRSLSAAEVVNVMNDSGLPGGNNVNPTLTAPIISSFTASPNPITWGQTTTLSWVVSGNPAPTVSIDNGVGAVTGNSVAVIPPLATKTFTLTASNSVGTTTAQATVSVTGVISVLNQSYSSSSASRNYDLFYSATSTNPATNPIVMYIHGGGWYLADPQEEWLSMPIFQPLLQAGFNVMYVNYRISNTTPPTNVFPAAVQDVKCMLQYVASNSGTKILGDPNRITLFGTSAGGHLVLMAGMTPKSLFGDNCESTSTNYHINDIAAPYPPIDLNTLYTTGDNTAQFAVSTFLGYIPSTNPSGAAAASPISYVSTSSPPILLETGSNDTTVPPSQIAELVNAFANIGVSTTALTFNGFGHGLDLGLGMSGQAGPPLINFIFANGKTFSSDTTPPTLIFNVQNSNGQNLTAGSAVDGNITFTASSTDPIVAGQGTSGLASLQLMLDGTVVATSTNGSLTYTVNTEGLSDSNHVFVAIATDKAGNVAQSQLFKLNEAGFTVGQ